MEHIPIVDLGIWLIVLYMAIRYGVMDWRKDNPMMFTAFLCVYGGFLIYRLVRFNILISELIRRCNDAGIDLDDILPPGSY